MSAKTGYGPDVNVLWHDRKRWCGLPLSFTRYRIIEKPTKWLKLRLTTKNRAELYRRIVRRK